MENITVERIKNPLHTTKSLEPKKATDKDLTLDLAKKILAVLMNYRRVPKIKDTCKDIHCPSCTSLHLPKIVAAINKGQPVPFVLPAFPGKSPNTEKVLGPLPDYAEQLALSFLVHLGEQIKKIYPLGIKIFLCSDGRVFSDLIGMKESDVGNYQTELKLLIDKISGTDIMIANLDDFYQTLSFSQMRDQLMNQYGQSLESLKIKVAKGKKPSASPEEHEANRMYCGITRFLFEDSIYAGQTKSRSAIQKESRSKAYEVIRRSNAWSELIANHYPQAIRLSIHPQSCGSKKLGVRLIADESWMTPWHGVAVECKTGYVLLKRYEAEALGAELIYSSEGRPSHFKLMKVL